MRGSAFGRPCGPGRERSNWQTPITATTVVRLVADDFERRRRVARLNRARQSFASQISHKRVPTHTARLLAADTVSSSAIRACRSDLTTPERLATTSRDYVARAMVAAGCSAADQFAHRTK